MDEVDLAGVVLGVSLGGVIIGLAGLAKAISVLKRMNPSLEECLATNSRLQKQLEECKARVVGLEDRVEELKKRLRELGEAEARRGLVLYYAYRRGIVEIKPRRGDDIVLLDDCIVVKKGDEGERFCLDLLMEQGEKHG